MRPSSRRDETPFLGAHRHAPGLMFRTSKGNSWRPPWEDPHAGGLSAIETTGKASVGQSTGAAEESRDIGARSQGGKRLQVFEIPVPLYTGEGHSGADCTETRLRTKTEPVLGQKPHFTVRTLEVPGGGATSQESCAYFLSQVSQGPPREPHPWGPPCLGPSSPPSSECCRKHWDPSFSAGVPLLAVSAPLSWTQSPGRKREWEMVKAGKSLFGHQERKRVGTLGVGWAHTKRTPPLQVAFFWCQPPSPSKLRASFRALDRASQCQPPSWAQSHPPIQWEGHMLLPTVPCTTYPLGEGLKPHCPVCCHGAPPSNIPGAGPMPTVHEAA